jgi:hypothetical protein
LEVSIVELRESGVGKAINKLMKLDQTDIRDAAMLLKEKWVDQAVGFSSFVVVAMHLLLSICYRSTET